MILFFRFIGFLIRFWYISLPIILALYFYLRRRFAILSRKIFGNAAETEETQSEDVIDAEFTVVDEDEEL